MRADTPGNSKLSRLADQYRPSKAIGDVFTVHIADLPDEIWPEVRSQFPEYVNWNNYRKMMWARKLQKKASEKK